MNAPTSRPLRTRAFRLALCAGIAMLGLAGCSINPVSAKGSLAATVTDAKSVIVSNENGSVELIHDPAATAMEITAAIRCTGDTEAKAAARVKATKLTAMRGADGRVTVGVDFPPREPAVTVVFVGTISASDDSASIVIRAANLDGIEVATTNGSIEVGAFRGPAKLVTANGSIEVNDHAGPIEARSSNGAIRASGVLAPVVAETSNGRIEVVLAPEAQGDIELETSNGSVSLELGEAWQGTVSADTSNGRVELAGGEVVRTVGSTTMTIGDATKAKATIDTSNGRITVRAMKK
jgi:DUF4097 and DUF4098 domain-containing protein YvlB